MGLLDSIFGGITNYLLQKDQQNFNHSEAQIAYNRALEADSTKYQRQVADMQAAGLNPMLAAGGSAGSVQASPASSGLNSAPSSNILSNLIASKQLKMQSDLNDATIDKIEAETGKIESETEGQDLANLITRATSDAQIEASELRNELDRQRIRQVDAQVDEISSHIRLMAKQAQTEDEKKSYYVAQSILSRANAQQIVEMLPYEKAYKSAATEEARQAALLSAAHAAYQNGLLTSGYLDEFVREQRAQADSAEAKAQLDRISAAIRTGDYSGVKGLEGRGMINTDTGNHLFSAIAMLLDNFNPLNNIFK